MPRMTKQHQLNEQLFSAVEANDIEAAKKAIESGADVNAENETSYTPLHWAAYLGHTKTAQLLINNDAIINARGNLGWTPCCLAILRRKTKTATLLKKHGGLA